MEYGEFVEVYEALSLKSGRYDKTGLLAEFLKKLRREGKPEWIYLLRGRVVPDYDARELGISGQLMIKAISKALGIKDIVTSPTYNLEQDYGNGKLNHIDVWRLRSVAELRDLEIDKYIRQKSVIAIEWADKITDAVRPMHEDAVVLWVEILYGIKNEERIIYWGIEKG